MLFSGAMLLGCVDVSTQPVSVQHVDSLKLVLHVDSAAIYRCDTCAFAKVYLKQISGLVKPCKTCAWVSLPKPKHDKGDVPEPENLPVNPLAEQDAVQHGTTSLVVPQSDSGSTSGERVVNRNPENNAPKEGDGI